MIIANKNISRQIYYEITPARAAILDLIAYTEGTDRSVEGKRKTGYDILFGHGKFNSFKSHPRIRVRSGGLVSSAAGRYQILDKTWDWLQARLKSTGFSSFPSFAPEYQDQAALFLIDAKQNALSEVDGRNINRFLEICSWEWASLPPARYGQPILSARQCRELYARFLQKWNS